MTISVYQQNHIAITTLVYQCLFILIVCITKFVLTETNNIDNNINNNLNVNSHGFELTQANNLQRQELIQNVCEQYFNSNENTLDGIPDDQLQHLLVDERHQLLYCYVPKVSKNINLSLFFCRYTKIILKKIS